MRSSRALVNTGRIELPDNPVLLTEFGRVRQKPGRDEVVTPRSGDSHSDLLLATAAAVLAHERRKPHRPLTWASPAPLVRAQAEERWLNEIYRSHGVGGPGAVGVIRPPADGRGDRSAYGL